MVLSKIFNIWRIFVAVRRRNPLEEMLAERLQVLQQKRVPPTPIAPLVAIGAPASPVYYAVLGEIISALCARQSLRTEQICTQALWHGAAQSLRHLLRAKLDFNSLTRQKWEKLYGIFCDRVGYRATDWIDPLRAMHQWQQAWCIWWSLRDKDHLAALSHNGIVIGDLVIDTYLRLRPTTTVVLNDLYLLVVIRQALKDVYLAFAYFRRTQPAAFLSMYTTYLQHGIPARVALACDVKVLTFGNLQEFCTQVFATHLYHTKPSARYSADFDAMPDPMKRTAQAAQALESRLSGRIDNATAYMKKSAYAVAMHEVPDVRGAMVVFLHDFYDSVHIYPWVMFHDFWEWICFTIDTLQTAGRDFWIKPHPNQGAQSSVEIDALKHKYPNAKFLPTDITNRQLANAGMACAVTVYGSVAPEMAFLGIPSISSGDSPHSSFDAFHLPRTRRDYARLLCYPPKPEKERLKAHSCAFYYMHNLNLDLDSTLLRDRFVAVWVQMFAVQETACFDREEIASVLAALTDNKAFQNFSDTLLSTNPS